MARKRKIKHRSIIFATVLILLQLGCSKVWARLATAYQAEQVVTGWLKADAQPLGTAIGQRVAEVETFTNDNGEPIYYIVYLQPSGFVIVPADDLVEPIIGFADDGTYNPSLENPLGALVTADLNARVAAARANHRSQTGAEMLTFPEAQSKWNHFITLAEGPEDKLIFMGLSSISDVRVAPLVQTKWSQSSVCGNYCYNYYTPNNYYCGCVATAMAQLMRYHQHPTTGIEVHYFMIGVKGIPQMASTRGGDGHGGMYNWSDMVLVPNCSTTPAQREAIGALCYDAGVAVRMDYNSDGSAASLLDAKNALVSTFKYENAIYAQDNGGINNQYLFEIINPNLDYGSPVILGILNDEGGHAVVCDGYGYAASVTLYHHLNMGWAGIDDAWYNLPTVLDYDTVDTCIYNIFIDGTGEIISGRVLDSEGNPIADAVVCAEPGNRWGPYEAPTDSKGIYAFGNLSSNTTYTIWPLLDGYIFTSQKVKTKTSHDYSATSGNVWEVNFVGTLAGDFDGDSDVDAMDFAIFASAWLTESGDAGWNPDCDISTPTDNFIGALDLAVFVNNWLAGIQ